MWALVLLGNGMAGHLDMNVVCQSCSPGWPRSRTREEEPGTGYTLQSHILIDLLLAPMPHQVLSHPAVDWSVGQSILGTLHIQTTTRNLKYVKKKSGHGPGRHFLNGAKVDQLYTESGGEQRVNMSSVIHKVNICLTLPQTHITLQYTYSSCVKKPSLDVL